MDMFFASGLYGVPSLPNMYSTMFTQNVVYVSTHLAPDYPSPTSTFWNSSSCIP